MQRRGADSPGRLSSVSPSSGGVEHESDEAVSEKEVLVGAADAALMSPDESVGAILPLLARLGGTTVLSSLASFAITFCALAFSGRFGSDELSAAGLSVMIANSTGFSLCWGLLSGLETLGSQAVGSGASCWT